MKKISLLLIILVIPLIQSEEQQSYESEHFVFYYSEGYLSSEELSLIAQTQEDLFTKITGLLSLEYTGKITYYLYGDRKYFEGIPGAYAAGNQIHLLCVFCEDSCKNGLNDAHELTHAISNKMGFQHGLLAEGLAVYIDDYVINGENLHGIVKILHTEERLTPLKDLIDEFWCDLLYNYDISGSFAVFLIEEYGIEKFKELYQKSLLDDSFQEVYSKSLSDLEEEWLSTVEKAEVTKIEEDIVRYRDGIQEGLTIYFGIEFDFPEYATYPARAEEGICLFRREYPLDPEKAFSYLDQFNKGLMAWKEAIETFSEAMVLENIEMKAELFRKAAELYEIAGDGDMIILSGKYATAYESLVFAYEYMEKGNGELALKKLEEVTPLLGELEEEEEILKINQYIQIMNEENLEPFEMSIVLIVAGVFTAMIIIRKLTHE
ncbi:MAG: hypothetical protein HXS44_05255 [Theionarchaea archaeon]|nr:hypothetical protein [Theionarchaea archaeon]